MNKYRNIIEEIIEEKYNEIIGSFDVCNCSICKGDVISYALNKFPPKYVVSDEGYLYSKVVLDNNEFNLEIAKAVTQGIKIVSKNPRHQKSQSQFNCL
ncbi:MAG: late competence development ComFB family protein [Oscillospiraceae bacterium]